MEINHGNGYVTRYGKNDKILVKVGEKVNKAMAISVLGSTGCWTDPLVHFEVILNGVVVDPRQYFDATR